MITAQSVRERIANGETNRCREEKSICENQIKSAMHRNESFCLIEFHVCDYVKNLLEYSGYQVEFIVESHSDKKTKIKW